MQPYECVHPGESLANASKRLTSANWAPPKYVTPRASDGGGASWSTLRHSPYLGRGRAGRGGAYQARGERYGCAVLQIGVLTKGQGSGADALANKQHVLTQCNGLLPKLRITWARDSRSWLWLARACNSAPKPLPGPPCPCASTYPPGKHQRQADPLSALGHPFVPHALADVPHAARVRLSNVHLARHTVCQGEERRAK